MASPDLAFYCLCLALEVISCKAQRSAGRLLLSDSIATDIGVYWNMVQAQLSPHVFKARMAAWVAAQSAPALEALTFAIRVTVNRQTTHTLAAEVDALLQLGQHIRNQVPAANLVCEAFARRINIKEAFYEYIAIIKRDQHTYLIPFRTDFLQHMFHSSAAKAKTSYLAYPFIFPASIKRQLLRFQAAFEMSREFQRAFYNHALSLELDRVYRCAERQRPAQTPQEKALSSPYLVLTVRRGHETQDVFNCLARHPQMYRRPLKVRYISSGEQGLDLGGLQKELLKQVWEDVSNPEHGLFIMHDDSRFLWFQTSLPTVPARHFELCGILLGLALFNGIMLNLHFPAVFFSLLLGHETGLEDFASLFPVQAQSLQMLLDYDGDVSEWTQTFSIMRKTLDESYEEVDIVPNGRNIEVTNANRQQFVDAMVQYYLHDAIEHCLEPFRRGFLGVCGCPMLYVLTAAELESLLVGARTWNIADLRAGATYEDQYTENHPTIVDFWEVIFGMTQEEQRQFVEFVTECLPHGSRMTNVMTATGSDREPVGGLGSLRLCVQRNGPDSDRLPTSLTCFNRLLLPEYDNIDKLRSRLLTAIQHSKGFGLV
ncbi:uncharacterized protein MONBRDRAFT_30711 [Monosiga brevicollis MX1]|uniref:HECT-type E3 ubiquitin transferase n=1 Tax=Monosiga brevicollis TaxID=81824 RepID=A9UNQ5_MONBE|nr:uncharacterized protein MONBRDRAFT_30711 [Monosiga brevicollis MX1]EDQ92285.1 predicted protein [Monosiga brevicollis MX1]|eukprot:XP_001742047.1 hypothetical protein [Monosiga brevicollis MX1]